MLFYPPELVNSIKEKLNYLYIKDPEEREDTIYVSANSESGMSMFKSLGQ